ncbi:methyltransferase domain-containing protein [candidate division KSB1 bacterium]
MEEDNTYINEQYNKGIELFESGKFSESAEIFHQIVAKDPKCSPAWNNLGVVASREDRHSDAEIFFQKAVEADPANNEAAVNLADTYFSSKQYTKAEKLYEYLMQKFPENAEFCVRRGDCFVMFAEYNSAFPFYSKAAQISPENNAVQQRINITAAALTPIPFAVAGTIIDKPMKILLGKGTEILAGLFEQDTCNVIQFQENLDNKDLFFEPADMIFARNDPSFFADNPPAVCRILILDTVPDSIDLSKGDRLRNIDMVFVKDETDRRKLVEILDFADYQAAVLPVDDDTIDADPENIQRMFLDLYAELVLFYAQRFQLQDCHEQEFWLLSKAANTLKDSTEISRKYDLAKKKINHLFNTDEYQELYDESASFTGSIPDVTGWKRYAWIRDQVKSYPELKSVVDVGCHKGEFCFALADEGIDVTGVDIAEANIKAALYHSKDKDSQGKLEFLTGSADKVDTFFPENSFDGALLLEILEHVPDVDEVLRSVEKIVRPGGYVFVTVPFTHLELLCNLIFDTVREFPEHVRRFTPENIPVYFRGKKDLHIDEILATSGSEQWKWFGIRYKVE